MTDMRVDLLSVDGRYMIRLDLPLGHARILLDVLRGSTGTEDWANYRERLIERLERKIASSRLIALSEHD